MGKLVDVIMGMSYSDERARTYKFGMGYASLYQAAVYRKGETPIKTIQQLKNRRVLVDKGDILEDLLRKGGLTKEIIPMDNISHGLRMLSGGKVDAVLCSHEVAHFFIDKLNIVNLDKTSMMLFPQEYGYAGKDGRLIAMMDHSMMQLKADGEYEQIYNK